MDYNLSRIFTIIFIINRLSIKKKKSICFLTRKKLIPSSKTSMVRMVNCIVLRTRIIMRILLHDNDQSHQVPLGFEMSVLKCTNINFGANGCYQNHPVRCRPGSFPLQLIVPTAVIRNDKIQLAD